VNVKAQQQWSILWELGLLTQFDHQTLDPNMVSSSLTISIFNSRLLATNLADFRVLLSPFHRVVRCRYDTAANRDPVYVHYSSHRLLTSTLPVHQLDRWNHRLVSISHLFFSHSSILCDNLYPGIFNHVQQLDLSNLISRPIRDSILLRLLFFMSRSPFYY